MKIVLDEGAFMPIRAHENDGGLDLRTPVDIVVPPMRGKTVHYLGQGRPDELVGDAGCVAISTGVHVEIPHGYFGKIESKSGLNVKRGIVACGGTIDEGYTGGIVVKLYNLTSAPYHPVHHARA